MTHPYVYWMLSMDQQEQITRRAAMPRHSMTPETRRGRTRRLLARRSRPVQLGHAVTARRTPAGCIA